MRMLAVERHREILSRVEFSGSVKVGQLARELKVAEETIRRDLEKLHADGRLVRTRGGALRLDNNRREIPFDLREIVNLEEKRAIAGLAVEHVAEGDVIALDASSTVRELARLIPDMPLTVVTNSIAVTTVLLDRSRVRVISTGGILDGPLLSYVGSLAEEALERFHIDKVFLSCKGFDIARGLSVATDEHARIKRRMMELAGTVYLLVDSSKFGQNALELFAQTGDVDYVITDRGAGRTSISKLKRMGISVETSH